MLQKIKKIILYGLAMLGILFVVIMAIAIIQPSSVNPEIIETGCLHPSPIIQNIGRLTPHIIFVDTGSKYYWDNTTTYYAYLKNDGKSGNVLVKLQFYDKDMNLLKEYSDSYYFNENEAKKVQFIVHTPENTTSYRFSVKSLSVPEYYADIINNGTSGKILVVLQFRDKDNNIIKNYSETVYLKSGESKRIKFFVEPPNDTASYYFHVESLEVPEYYAIIKNVGDSGGKIKVVLDFIDYKGNIIKEYSKFDYLDKKETKKICFFVNPPENTSKYEFYVFSISD